MAGQRPYSRAEYNRALVANALLDPFAVVVLTVVVIAGIVLGALPILLPVGLVLYGVAAGRTYLDEVEGAELPYVEVLDEVDRFVTAMEGTARRAQLLYEALAESPPADVERRLEQVE